VEPSIGAGTHFEKHLKTGLKSAMVEKRWFTVFIVTCARGIAVVLDLF